MDRYETPEDIATVLARFAPEGIRYLLDPAVGRGRLVQPLLGRLSSRANVVCLDVDRSVLEGAASSLRPVLGARLRAEAADFLEWSLAPHRRGVFDCIIMNPPFLGKKKDETELSIRWNGVEYYRSVSVEAAFTIRCLDLLADRGVLLSVLPASLVSGKNASWIRKIIMSYGSVRYVHELPAKAFQRVEARLYLFAFERNGIRRPTLLCNHDLNHPERLWVKSSELSLLDRWDYAFHDARRKLEIAAQSTPNLGWLPVGDAVTMSRGSLQSPNGKKRGVHTCDFHHGVWQLDRAGVLTTGGQGLRCGDILIRRVGRHCARSAGIVLGHPAVSATDCVLILRPYRSADAFSLLLGLRCILGAPYGASLIEQGTGATYIAEDSLKNLRIPTRVREEFPEIYAQYVESANTRSGGALEMIEARLRNELRIV